MATNYSSWSVSKLTRERDRIDKAIEARSKENKKSLIAKVKTLAAESGIDLAELLGGEEVSARPARKKRSAAKKSAKKAVGKKRTVKKKAGDKRRGPAPQIYRNPDNHDETWSGRGRPPRWAADYIASGGDKEDLRY